MEHKGYTLEGAKKQLKSHKQSNKVRFDAIESLRRLKLFLVELRNNLDKDV